MQLRHFQVSGLFGGLDHAIPFPLPGDQGSAPTIVVLYGRNGVGKTTVLRMLDGMLRLDFNPFRRVPFSSCNLEFDSGDRLTVTSRRDGDVPYLEVTYSSFRARLGMGEPGAFRPEDEPLVDQFRTAFFDQTKDIHLEFIDTERLHQLDPRPTDIESVIVAGQPRRLRVPTPEGSINPKARATRQHWSLADRVARFMQEAQVNYRAFFSSTEPDLFPRIIERLTSGEEPSYTIDGLRECLERIHAEDAVTERFGLEPDRWDFDQTIAALENISDDDVKRRAQALTVLGSYVEVLESHAAERALLAERLHTFERLMGEFFTDKTVTIDSLRGFRIEASSGGLLEENQLSSGEFHLLFLMVAALATRRHGTIIAIDEPEMSMHLAWQRRLLPALLECASNAEPLFIFATHSPDLAAAYPEAMIELE